MNKKVLILSASYRVGGNSETLSQAFADGASAAGHTVETIRLCDHTIGFCRGCLACQKTGTCVIRDDAVAIAAAMKEAQVLVFATPIYYYEMAGQLKTMLDRANPLYGSNYKFRDIYFLSVAADDGDAVPARAVAGLGGWVECFPECKLAGTVFAGGVNDVGDIAGHEALQRAFAMGNRI